jgi:hypothetical protein
MFTNYFLVGAVHGWTFSFRRKRLLKFCKRMAFQVDTGLSIPIIGQLRHILQEEFSRKLSG